MIPHPLMKCFRLKTKNVRHLEITKIRINSVCTYLKHLKISQVIRILVANSFHQRAYIFQRKVVAVTVHLKFLSLQNSINSKSRNSSNNNNRRSFKITETF